MKDGIIIATPANAATHLNGSAMPRIIEGFSKQVFGRTIAGAGYITLGGAAWPCLILDNRAIIIAQADDEGNGPGVLWGAGTGFDGTQLLCHTTLKG